MERKPDFRLYLSYSRKDKALIDPLIKDLGGNGIQVFYDGNIIEDGGNWQNQLTRALAEANGIIVLISPNSINSQYVMNELGMARSLSQDPNNPKLLLPVVYGEVEIPIFIRDIQVIFWRDNYNEVISRIVNAVNSFENKRYETGVDQQNRKEKDSSTTTTTKTTTTIEPPETSNIENAENTDETANPSKTNLSPGYWLLKMNPETWPIDQLRVGEKTFFSPFFKGIKRPEYRLFAKIKKGDFVLCQLLDSYQGIVCEMEVTEPVGKDKAQGETFKMIVKNLFTPPVPLNKFEDRLPNTIPKLIVDKKLPELLFQLDEAFYSYIWTLFLTRERNEKPSYQPFYLTEGNHVLTDDKLEFQNDINSFASVIALKKVNPPLAIGLFGNWGSGKSFFMEKLSEQISNLANSENEDYVKNVVQVKFNSWHYSDANLWASLITEIFDSLKAYAKGQNEESEITKLQRTLKTAVLERRVVEENRKVLEEKIELLVSEQVRKRKNLEDITGIGLLKLILSNRKIKDDLAELKNDHIEHIIEDKNNIDRYISELENAGNKTKYFLSELFKFRSRKWYLVLGAAIFIALCPFIFRNYLSDLWNHITWQISTIFSITATALSKIIASIKPFRANLNNALERLTSLKQTLDTREQVGNPELVSLKADLNYKRDSIFVLDQQISDARDTINDIATGRWLIKFIEERANDSNYNSALGLISRVRKDFDTLDKLLREQHTLTDEQRNELFNPEGVQLKIDRIILYIDDLDRCDEQVVVRVLEAIHLILAFPLFVVVVGVDPRWLNNALSEKYKYLFGLAGKNNPKEDEMKTANVNQSEVKNPLLTNAATSYDYLEKIFQIPFALKPINKTGRENLIQYLIRDEMQTTGQGKTIEADLSYTQNVTDSVDAEVVSGNEEEKKISTPLEEDKVQKEKREKEKLVFSTDELNYMQKISFLFGKTPRSINRYVNIYRIIKAHDSLEDKGKFDEDVFKPIMFLLGVIVGYSLYAKDFIDQIAKADDRKKFSTFINDIKIDDSFKTDLKSVANEINDMLMVDFKRNLGLISRFSFRILIKDS